MGNGKQNVAGVLGDGDCGGDVVAGGNVSDVGVEHSSAPVKRCGGDVVAGGNVTDVEDNSVPVKKKPRK